MPHRRTPEMGKGLVCSGKGPRRQQHGTLRAGSGAWALSCWVLDPGLSRVTPQAPCHLAQTLCQGHSRSPRDLDTQGEGTQSPLMSRDAPLRPGLPVSRPALWSQLPHGRVGCQAVTAAWCQGPGATRAPGNCHPDLECVSNLVRLGLRGVPPRLSLLETSWAGGARAHVCCGPLMLPGWSGRCCSLALAPPPAPLPPCPAWRVSGSWAPPHTHLGCILDVPPSAIWHVTSPL